MRRYCLLLLAFVALIQRPVLGLEIGYGAKAGLTWSTFMAKGGVGDPFLPNQSSRVGFSVGPFCNIGINRVLTAQIEALFTQKGARGWQYTVSSGGVVNRDLILKEEYNLTYLDIPILAKVYPLKNQVYRPYLITGPALSINLDEKYKNGVGSVSASIDVDYFESTCFGFIVGGGLEYAGFFMEMRSDFGMTRADKIVHQDWRALKNRTISVFGGYRF
ncbi:PorT family protein [bacterium]|nr:PorT family protein [bacterium]